MYARCIWETINTNFVSSVLGGFLATVFFWVLFEQRIKNLLEYSEKKKIAKTFLEELLYNRIVASESVEKRSEYSNSAKFTFLRYDTDSIEEFVKSEPLSLEKSFYSRVQILYSAGLKKDNMLLDIFWFTPQATEMDREGYKKTFLDNAQNNVSNIDETLRDDRFISEMRKLGLVDDTERTKKG